MANSILDHRTADTTYPLTLRIEANGSINRSVEPGSNLYE
jgi:hypothetical protein